jgi:hypothetical protein
VRAPLLGMRSVMLFAVPPLAGVVGGVAPSPLPLSGPGPPDSQHRSAAAHSRAWPPRPPVAPGQSEAPAPAKAMIKRWNGRTSAHHL